MAKLFVVFLLLIASQITAQNHKIDIYLPGAANKTVQLGYHYINKVYIRDTTMLNEEGYGTWQGDSPLPQGLYKVFLNKTHHFDFLLGKDQEFSLSNSTFVATDTKIQGSLETEEFIDYLKFLLSMKRQSSALNKQLNKANEEEKKEIHTKLNALNNEMRTYWAKTGEKYPESLLYKFMIANEVPSLDITSLPEEIQKNDSLLNIARFNYLRAHYWDYFDYTDERLLYTPFYKTKLEKWFNTILYPSYDSVKPYVYSFLKDVKSSQRILQYTTSYFLNQSINSKIMGMDALFVDLARDFYLTGEAFWASDESLEKIRENVLFFENNLIGNTAPDLTLESFKGDYKNLHEIQSELTMVLIYEPNCSHCKEMVPKIYKDIYLPNSHKGLQVYAIYSMSDKKEWEEFLNKHQMFDWINVWDEYHTSGFKVLYDARKTPCVYILDQNKEIIAKKLNMDGIKVFINKYLN